MFAIIENGGKQYKVAQGDIVRLESFEAKEGEKVTFKQVLLTSDDKKIEIGQPFLSAAVEAKVVSHGRGDKIRVVKYKSKKRQHKVQGHRQNYTEVEILSIGSAKATKSAAPKKETAEKETAEKETAEKAPATKKPAAKKAPAKKPAAKKSVAKK